MFVPRRRSEFLVDTAVSLARGPDPVIVDLCCGTGALGLAVAVALGGAELHAADIDPAAVACARRNVEPAGGHVYQGDLFGPLPRALRGRVGILICNAPYVPSQEVAFLPPEARDYEPRGALDGGHAGSPCSAGSRRRRPAGWPLAVRCWWRPATSRRRP